MSLLTHHIAGFLIKFVMNYFRDFFSHFLNIALLK